MTKVKNPITNTIQPKLTFMQFEENMDNGHDSCLEQEKNGLTSTETQFVFSKSYTNLQRVHGQLEQLSASLHASLAAQDDALQNLSSAYEQLRYQQTATAQELKELHDRYEKLLLDYKALKAQAESATPNDTGELRTGEDDSVGEEETVRLSQQVELLTKEKQDLQQQLEERSLEFSRREEEWKKEQNELEHPIKQLESTDSTRVQSGSKKLLDTYKKRFEKLLEENISLRIAVASQKSQQTTAAQTETVNQETPASAVRHSEDEKQDPSIEQKLKEKDSIIAQLQKLLDIRNKSH